MKKGTPAVSCSVFCFGSDRSYKVGRGLDLLVPIHLGRELPVLFAHWAFLFLCSGKLVAPLLE